MPRPAADTVSFEITQSERADIQAIAKRAKAIAKKTFGHNLDVLGTIMDLAATHANGCPLDFQRLLQADDFNLLHDVFGIARHIDRETGKLTGCFLPRFAASEQVPA